MEGGYAAREIRVWAGPFYGEVPQGGPFWCKKNWPQAKGQMKRSRFWAFSFRCEQKFQKNLLTNPIPGRNIGNII